MTEGQGTRAVTDLDLPAEERILVTCARGTSDPAAGEELAILVGKGIDWELLRAAALRHGMLVILAKCLADHAPQIVPPPILEELRDLYLRNLAATVRRLAEAERLVSKLAEAGISAVYFKGPILSWVAYGDAGLRVSTDMDLLVARDEVNHAIDVLAVLDYRPQSASDYKHWPTILRFRHARPLVRTPPAAQLDLHWAIASRRIACKLDVREMVLRSHLVDVDGFRLLSLRTDDLILAMCIHGAKHDWNSLELVCSLAGVVNNGSDVDWAATLESATNAGCRRRCLLGALLAAEVGGASVPKWVLEKALADRAVARLAAAAMKSLSANQSTATTRASHRRRQMASLDGYRAKARYTLLRVVEPTRDDWDTVRLPAALSFLHYTFRPPRLLLEHARRTAKHKKYR